MFNGFACHALDGHCSFHSGKLPNNLQFSPLEFDHLWQLHPAEFHVIKMWKPVKTPRWQQAYGVDYQYTGRVNQALPIPENLKPLHVWTRQHVFSELNGLLLNWYDGRQDHYIGKHRDSTINMVQGAPIVTISFGEERTFRLRPWKRPGKRDFLASNSSVFIMPYSTNLAWTHEVTRSKKLLGRRISATFRAFES